MSVDTVEKAIHSILTNDAGVSALVSGRVYPSIIPQGTALPAITYMQTAGGRNHTLGGSDDMVPGQFEITVVDDSYGTTRTISDAVRGALDSYTGLDGSVYSMAIFLVGERDGLAQTPGTDVLRRYSKTLTFDWWWVE